MLCAEFWVAGAKKKGRVQGSGMVQFDGGVTAQLKE